jgi:hypothetical protein
LLQVLTPFTKNDILKIAQTGIGEWTELAEEYCEVTNLPVHDLLGALQRAGLTPVDIHNIEYLEDRKVLEALPGGFRWLKRNLREDVILYLETFGMLLQKDLDKRTGDIINQALEQQEIPAAADESISQVIVNEVVNA